MDEVPVPESYVTYPRASAGRLDTAARLQSLSEGYYGLYKVLFLNVVLCLILIFPPSTTPSDVWSVGFLCLAAIVGSASFPFIRKIGYGLSWSRSRSVVASCVVGICSLLCFGILGVWIYQRMAAEEMARLGVKRHWFGGVRRSEIEARVAELGQIPGPLPRILNPSESERQ